MIITIDGPIATGKSTIAKQLAHKIRFIYFDTGAMYRCVAWAIINQSIHFRDPQELANFLDRFDFDIRIKHGQWSYFVGENDVTVDIRMPEVTALVSEISAIREVREKLVLFQREQSVGINAIFEGRDMGTVVFPDARLKIYLTGSPEVRAKRRFDELREKFPEETKNLTIEETIENINRRDAHDSSREISPLKEPEDAYVVDTTDLSINEIVYQINEYKDNRPTSHGD